MSSSRKTTFATDMQFEKNSSRYLEDKTSFVKDFGILGSVMDKDTQLAGVDYMAESEDGKIMKIDAKAIAQSFGTFAFELEGNISTRSDGWFIKDNQTTHYAIIYHEFKKCEGYLKNKRKPLNNKTLHQTEVLLINKEKLQTHVNEWFSKSEYSNVKEFLNDVRTLSLLSDIEDSALGKSEKDVENIRLVLDDGEFRERNSSEFPTFTVVATRKYIKEKPINLVVRKDFLKSIADKSIVYKS